MYRSVCPRKCGVALASILGVAVVLPSLSAMAQSGKRIPSQSLIEQLLPNGEIPKNLRVEPAEREDVIHRLKTAQVTANGRRAQQIAFILAALNVEYSGNRNYLLHALSGCNYPQIRYGCDYLTGEYLVFLYKHGHLDVLAPLLATSVGSYDAMGREALGADFGEMIQTSPRGFLQALNALPVSTQKRVCYFAGSGDGGGLSSGGLAKARTSLRRTGGQVALRCLAEIEAANKTD